MWLSSEIQVFPIFFLFYLVCFYEESLVGKLLYERLE